MAEEQKSTWSEPAARVLALLRDGKASSAFDYLDRLDAENSRQQPDEAPLVAFREVAGLLYWQHKALPEYVTLSQKIIRRLAASISTTEGDPDVKRIRALGGSCYNLACFAWPGWNEPGIVVGPGELEAGRCAAERCLEIRRDPAYAGVPFSYSLAMAHWAVGAYCLQDQEWQGARLHFDAARRANQEAGVDHMLEAGYLALVDLLERPGDAGARQGFETAVAAAKGHKDADFIQCQLVTASDVFCSNTI